MGTFRETLSRKTVRVGLVLLFLALILSIIALKSYTKGFSMNGTITNGTKLLSPPGSAVVINSTLILKGNGTVMVTVHKPHVYTLNGTSSIVLNLKNPPLLSTINGSIEYEYKGLEAVYPYSNLSIPAFVFMLAGTVLIITGIMRFVRNVKEERNRNKRERK